MRLIDEIAYQRKIAKIPMEKRTFVKAWETAQDMPTIDAVPVARGRWTQTNLFDEEANVYVCSVCGEPWTLNAGTPQENNMNFCPNCGARMDKEATDDNY